MSASSDGRLLLRFVGKRTATFLFCFEYYLPRFIEGCQGLEAPERKAISTPKVTGAIHGIRTDSIYANSELLHYAKSVSEEYNQERKLKKRKTGDISLLCYVMDGIHHWYHWS